MSEPKPGSVTIGPDGQYYIFFGGVWGKADGVSGDVEKNFVEYDSLTVKPEDSFNNAVNQIKSVPGIIQVDKKGGDGAFREFSKLFI